MAVYCDSMRSDKQDGGIDQLCDKLNQAADRDDLDLYLAPRAEDIGVQTPELKPKGLRLWLENNGAEVVHDPGNGYFQVVPEGDDAE